MDGQSVIVIGALLSCCFEAVYIGSKSFIILLLYLHKAWCISVNIGITELQPKDVLDFIPAFSHLKGLMGECRLGCVNWPQLDVCCSVKTPVVVSISMNQSSSFEESCPSNEGISYRRGCGEVLFSLCVMQGLCVSLHSFVHRFLIRLGVGGGWSIIVRCCSLSVSCINSAVGVGGWVADFKLAN